MILHVNSRTLKRLDAALAGSTVGEPTPEAKLLSLAQAYLDFALENINLWSALFKHRMPAGWPVPDWHVEEHRALFQHVMAPLGEIDPRLSGEARLIRARTIFAAVHGIVALSIEGKFVGLQREVVSGEVRAIVRALVRGLGDTPDDGE